MTAGPAPGAAPTRPLRLRALLTRLFILSGVIVAVCAVAGGLAFDHLADDRSQVVNRIDPANLLVSELLSNYLDEETGVRGYALSRDTNFLAPYQSGVQAVAEEDPVLTRLLPPGSTAGQLLAIVHREARTWRTQFAEPSVAATTSGNDNFDNTAELNVGKDLFDSLRVSFSALQNELVAERKAAENRLTTAADELATVMIFSLVVILLNGLIIWVALRRLVLRPLAAVGRDARVVSSGELEHEVRPIGPVEIAELAADVESMRQRIFAEVGVALDAQAQLATTNAELARSNEDLEQFAYVASHDLQEPLRKVASFCQLLDQRYGDQLDERGGQYIAFAVDGAKRMQILINDLLSFSRIGRTTDRFVDVDLADSLATAESNLAQAISAAGARIDAPIELPHVTGDPTLLATLLQNLVGNAIKFRSDEAPVVTVTATPTDEEMWMIAVADNGIGIEPRFADRIFVIFQRLHGREAYAGTGIGLALCRKIVEFHGGRIWLDTDHSPGTRFCFTLPKITPQEISERDHHTADQAG